MVLNSANGCTKQKNSPSQFTAARDERPREQDNQCAHLFIGIEYKFRGHTKRFRKRLDNSLIEGILMEEPEAILEQS